MSDIAKIDTREVVVSFACNDPDNGDFHGRATLCHWRTNHKRCWNEEIELDHDDFLDGTAIEVDTNLMTLTIHGVAYPWKRRIPWHGNWCWDGFVMKRPAALRLIRALRDSKEWHCTCAPVRMERWFDSVAVAAPANQNTGD